MQHNYIYLHTCVDVADAERRDREELKQSSDVEWVMQVRVMGKTWGNESELGRNKSQGLWKENTGD